MNKFKLTKQEKNWVLYDVGNSAFTLLICTILPIYFNQSTGSIPRFLPFPQRPTDLRNNALPELSCSKLGKMGGILPAAFLRKSLRYTVKIVYPDILVGKKGHGSAVVLRYIGISSV